MANNEGEVPKVNELKKPVVYANATAHLDTVWNWTLEDTVKRHIVRTLKENFELFEKYPNYKFNFEGAYRYELIKEYYPEAYEKMKEYIKQGRWFVTGSSWENGDVIVSSPEALIRNILYGNKYFKEEFGKISNDIFLPDCFGFAYTLPTIMNHMGLTAFSSAKLIWNAGNKVPFEVGIWKGIDGSEVVASLNPGQYVTRINEQWSQSAELRDHINSLPVGKTFKYYGTGDEGGAPTEASAKFINDSVDDKDSAVTVISAYAGQLADELTEEERKRLPVYDGELLMTTHGVGSYTSVAPTKRFNRKNELIADFAERSNVLASWLNVKDYPKDRLEKAWKMFVRHEFHDDLTGTSLQRVYKETFTDYITTLNEFVHELGTAQENIADSIDTSSVEDGIPVVVFNGITADRSDMVTASVTFDKAPKHIKVYDKVGKEVVSQIVERKNKTVKIIFLANVSSDGYATYKVVSSNEPCSISSGLKVSDNQLENNNYIVTIDSDGNISSVFDKLNDKELLDSPIRYEVLDNSYVHYGAWEILYDDVQKEPRLVVGADSGANKPIVKVVENGPARVSLEVTRQDGISTYTQVISLSANSEYVNVDNNVNWLEQSSLLKVAFPLTISNDVATYDAGLGAIDRGNNEKMMYEVPVHKWASLKDSSSEYNVTIMNDCKYGMDKPEDNLMRLTCIHTPQHKFLDGTRQDVQDFGENRFSYAIKGGKGNWQESESALSGAKYNQPLVAVQTTVHEGSLPTEYSFVKVDNDIVEVQAIKPAEDSDEIIIRVNEPFGENVKNVEIQIGKGIESAREVNGFEEHVGDAKVQDGKLVFDIDAFSLKTFAVKLAKSGNKVSQKQYVEMAIPCNTIISSTNMHRGEYGFNGNNATIPAEMLSDKLVVGAVPFNIEKAGDVHKGMLANGQKLVMPRGATKLYLVATATKEDKYFTFDVGGNPLKLHVQSLDSYIGGWDQYGSNHYGFIKHDVLAYSASHVHDTSGDKVYGKFSLYKYEIEIPEGAEYVALPDDNELLVVSATALVDGNADSKLVTGIIDVKNKRTTRKLTVINGTGSGNYVAGNPVNIIFTGDKDGDVTWKNEDGDEYNGFAIELSMPDKDMILTPHIKEFGENIAHGCKTTAVGEVEGNEASMVVDGKKDTSWMNVSLNTSWIILELEEHKTFDTVMIKHAGYGGAANTLNTSQFKVQAFVGDQWICLSNVKNNRLPVTVHKFEPVNSRYIRLVINKPSYNDTDKFARIYGIEVYNESNSTVPQSSVSEMTPFDMIDIEGEYDVLFKGDVDLDKVIELDDNILVKKWYVTNMSNASLYGGADESSMEEIDTATKKKFDNIQRVISGAEASVVKLSGNKIDAAKPCELTIIGKSLTSVLKVKWPASNAGSRNNYAVINDDHSVFLPKDDSNGGHDLFGLNTKLEAGTIRISMSVKIDAEQLAEAADELELFRFNPVFPGGDVSSDPITIADYKAAPENEKGYKIVSEEFIMTGSGGVEGRISSSRNIDMTVGEFAIYEV